MTAASEDAALLVVGHRPAGLAPGSVSSYCAKHARCPVVVVTGEETTAPQDISAGQGAPR